MREKPGGSPAIRTRALTKRYRAQRGERPGDTAQRCVGLPGHFVGHPDPTRAQFLSDLSYLPGGIAPAVVENLATRRGLQLRAGASDPMPAPVGLDGFDVLVRAWDDDELMMAWYQSEAPLHEAATVEDLARLAVVRQLYLDEIERRSPENFGRAQSTPSTAPAARASDPPSGHEVRHHVRIPARTPAR